MCASFALCVEHIENTEKTRHKVWMRDEERAYSLNRLQKDNGNIGLFFCVKHPIGRLSCEADCL